MSDGASPRSAFPYWSLLWEMTRGEAKLRDQGTVLGFFWTLLHPALMFFVLHALFSKWLGRFVSDYTAYLLCGLVLWNFFSKSTHYALTSFRRLRGTVLNYRFPREIVPLSAVGAVLWSSLLETAVLLAALWALGYAPRAAWIWLPVALALLAGIAAGTGLILAVAATELRDLERVWEVLVAALFYLTPVFYPLSIIGEDKRPLLALNPLAAALEAFRSAAIDGRPPSPSSLAALAAVAAALLVAGLFLVRRRETAVAEALLV
jgi:lipopolysaccharide transport system permease protein